MIRWFNKPKFHIFLHLVEHIRRFGPAILFATEAFESFNAVIRAKSIHSNRHAPSWDIAHTFAQGNCICHLMSGGLFNLTCQESNSAGCPFPADVRRARSLASVGSTLQSRCHKLPRPCKQAISAPWYDEHLIHTSQPLTTSAGGYVSDGKPGCSFAQTLTGQKLTHSLRHGSELKFKMCKSMYLHNGDLVLIGHSVIVCHPGDHMLMFIARVEEIIQLRGSAAEMQGCADGLLLRSMTSLGSAVHYAMPRLMLTDRWSLVWVVVSMPISCEALC